MIEDMENYQPTRACRQLLWIVLKMNTRAIWRSYRRRQGRGPSVPRILSADRAATVRQQQATQESLQAAPARPAENALV